MSRILIVDDEPHLTRLLAGYLAAKGHEAHTAADGSEAVRKARALRFDALLLDLIMPGQSGIDVLKTVKAVNPETVVILMTAVIDEQLIEAALESGADAFLTKPFQLAEMHEALDAAGIREGGMDR